MAVNDIFIARLTLSGSGQTLQNLFTYKATNSSANAVQLADWLVTNLVPDLRDILSDATTFNNIYVENLNSPTDFTTQSFAVGTIGNLTGEAEPVFNAMRFYSPTKSKIIRGGNKRFGMLQKASVEGDFMVTSGGFGTAISAMITTLNTSPVGASGGTFQPIIVKRTFVPATPTHKAYYTLPSVADSSNNYQANNWVFSDLVTTQDSRKRGVGA